MTSLPPVHGWKSRRYELTASVELSDRQAVGVLAAQRLGFFEVPRTATAAEIAEVVGVTTGAASRRIRSAECRIFHHLVPQIAQQVPDREQYDAADPREWLEADGSTEDDDALAKIAASIGELTETQEERVGGRA